MSDVVLAALFSTAGAAVVAVAGAIATIFGPAWRERTQRREEREAAIEAARYDTALEFIEAASSAIRQDATWEAQRKGHAAWSKFVATLRPGEGAVSEYAAAVLLVTTRRGREGFGVLDLASDRLFGWLRGDVTIDELQEQMRVLRRDHKEATRLTTGRAD